MGKCHIISTKCIGWEQKYDYYTFPTDKFSKEDAIDQFKPMQKETMKNNKWYPYTAYEYNGVLYHSIIYSGTEDEEVFK